VAVTPGAIGLKTGGYGTDGAWGDGIGAARAVVNKTGFRKSRNSFTTVAAFIHDSMPGKDRQ
jgi:hypothetical protein